MKSIIHNLCISLLVLAPLQMVGQNGIMVEVVTPEIVPTNTDGKLTSTNEELAILIGTNNILSFSRAFPTSQKEFLSNVYELHCACDEITLLAELTRLPKYFRNPEIIPAITPLHTPNDYNTKFAVDYSLDLINAQEAWNIHKGSSEVVIAITDSNFDLNHEELIGKFDYVQPNIFHTNLDHGTAVAVTAAGNTNNNLGKSSIGYHSTLRLYSMSYNSLLLASQDGARIINASWAGGCSYSPYYQALIDEITENGSLIVAAAGNGETCGGSSNYVYPASYNGVLSVTSVGPNDNHERQPGNPNSTHQHNNKIDLAAPGYDVPLAFKSNSYTTGNGSSFAAPLVSGTAALMVSLQPNLNNCEIEYLLKEGAAPLDSLNSNYAGMLGAGRLDAFASLQNTQSFTSTTVTHQILYSYHNPLGDVVIEPQSDLPISSFEFDYTKSFQDSNGDYYQEYTVEIVYTTGCTVQMKHLIHTDEFGTGDTLLVLPVDLTVFDAEKVNTTVKLTWETSYEQEVIEYQIYKSTDGLSWEYVGRIPAANDLTGSNYELVDYAPTDNLSYYALNRIDYNGINERIAVKSVDFAVNNNVIVTVYPNPSAESTTIQSNEEIESITLIDYQGRAIEKHTVHAMQAQLNFADAKRGNYILQITLISGKTIQEKLILIN